MLYTHCDNAIILDSGNKAHEEMRQACFDYLSLGGIYSAGPISLLSGLNPKPSVLVMHFFMVSSTPKSQWLVCLFPAATARSTGI